MTTATGEQLLSDYLARLDGAASRLPADRRAELLEGIAEHVAAARAAGELVDEAAVRTLLDRLGDPAEIVAAASEDVPAAGTGTTWTPPRGSAPSPQLVPAPAGTALETAAVLLLTVGSLLPVVGWLVGVALLWSSRRWRTSEKLLGTLVVPGGPGILLALSFLTLGRGTCSVSVVSPGLELSVPPLPETGAPGAPAPAAPPPPPELVPPPVVEAVETCADPVLPGPAVVALAVVVALAPFVVAVVLLRRARARAALEPPVLRRAGGSGWGGLEIAAVVVLGVGSFVAPVVGPVVGLVLTWSSARWTTQEKVVATVMTLVPTTVLLLSFGLALVGTGFAVAVFGPVLLFGLSVLGSAAAAGYLALVLSRRPAAPVR